MGLLANFILFIPACLFCFTFPGILFLEKSKTNLNYWEKVFLGTVIGFVAFTLLSYFLLVLKLSILILPTVIFANIFFFKRINLRKCKLLLPKKVRFALLLLVFLLGIAGQMTVIAPSGLFVNNDLVFWSAHGHDGSWHIALMEEFKKGYPFENPVFAGEKLVNYHFFSDIAPTMFNKYLGFSTLDLYFRLFPLLFSILLGASAYFLGKRVGKSFSTGLWTAIFIYFAGSFGFIVTWMKNQSIGGESIFWATQIQSSSGNPPQIISNFLILTFLIFLFMLLSKKDYIFTMAILLIAGALVGFKVYAAIVVIASLGLAGVWQFIRERKVTLIFLTVLSAIISAIIYLPNSSGSTSFLIFEPWWFIRTMVVEPSRLDWIDHELRRQTYIAENNLPRVIELEVTAFLIFFFGNLGMRFLAIPETIKITKLVYKDYFSLVFISIILISLIFPLLFLQKGVASNTSQFLQYFILLFGILAGISTAKLTKRVKARVFKVVFISVVLLLLIPTQVGLLYEFYSRPAFARIDQKELEALSFLKENSKENSIILTPPYNKYLDLQETTPNIWDWFDTGYVAAFSARRTYLSDTEQVDIMGYGLEKRAEIQKEIFSENINDNIQTIKENNITHLYFPKAQKPVNEIPERYFNKIFDNDFIEIWKLL